MESIRILQDTYEKLYARSAPVDEAQLRELRIRVVVGRGRGNNCRSRHCRRLFI